MRSVLTGLIFAATIVLSGCPDSDNGRTINPSTSNSSGSELSATDLSVTTDEDQPADGQLRASSSSQSTLTFALSQAADHGLASVNDDGRFTYTPAGDFNGDDQFTFEVSNTEGARARELCRLPLTPLTTCRWLRAQALLCRQTWS